MFFRNTFNKKLASLIYVRYNIVNNDYSLSIRIPIIASKLLPIQANARIQMIQVYLNKNSQVVLSYSL